jgi:hypothetical protein
MPFCLIAMLVGKSSSYWLITNGKTTNNGEGKKFIEV